MNAESERKHVPETARFDDSFAAHMIRDFFLVLVAEQFCVTCHLTAKPGDVLGSVTVRNYFSRHLTQWWHEVQLTSLLGLSKIVLHTIVLFFLLRSEWSPCSRCAP